MKRLLSVILTAALAGTAFAGCAQQTNAVQNGNGDGKLKVVSTIFPGYDFAREIAGAHAEITMLLPPGSESHSFEPTPQDIIKIQNSDLFIYGGGDSDNWADSILGSMDTSNMKILSMMDLVETMEEEIKEGMDDEREHSHSEDAEEREYDEHVWTSPVNAMKISQAIGDTLAQLDAENAAAYRQNTQSYIAQLEEVDQAFREVVRNATYKTLIFGDRFPFLYFAREYGLDYYAAFPGCATETEASAKTVAFLIDKINAEQIPVVFYIEFSNEKMADIISESTGVKKMLFHSCHNVSRDDIQNGVSYLELMRRNVETLREAIS